MGLLRREPRSAAELDAMRALQDARGALEWALDLELRAERAMADATVAHDEARREIRRIAEQKVRAPHG